MKVNGKMENLKEKEFYMITMVIYMKGIGGIIEGKEKELNIIMMVIYTRVILKMI